MNNFYKALFITLIIVFILSNSPFLVSQAGKGKGRQSGKVMDERGNPIVSAKITLHFLKNKVITREMTTDKKGKWIITGLGSGQWGLIISAPGFQSYQKTIIVSQLERNPSLNIALNKTKKKIIEKTPETDLFEKGNQLFREENYKAAIASYKEFSEKNPGIFHVHYSLGSCYMKMGDIDEAIREYQIVCESVNKENKEEEKLIARTFAVIGECYIKKEDLGTARNYFKQSLEINPENEILAYNVAEIYFSNQRMDEALKYYQLASMIKPDWSDPYLQSGYAYLNVKNNAKAIENFNKFLELEPDSDRSANVKSMIEYLK